MKVASRCRIVWLGLLALALGVGCGKEPSTQPGKGEEATPPERLTRPERLPEPPPVTGDKVYVWFLRADLRGEPSETSSEIVDVVSLGTTLTVRGTRGEWALVAKPAVNMQPKRGWIHLSQITRSATDVAAVRRTGLVPRAALVLRDVKSGDKLKAVMIGGDLGVVTKRGAEGAIERMTLAEGQCLWPADTPELRRMERLSLRQVGLGTIDSPRGNTLYWADANGSIASFRDRLAQAIDSPPEVTKGLLGFEAPASLCPEPLDVWWLPTGNNQEQGIVMDRRRGVVFLSVHPIRGLEEIARLKREGVAPQVMTVFQSMLAVGYGGKRAELVLYRNEPDAGWQEVRSQGLPAAPTAMLAASDFLYVGMADGRILSIDQEGKWVKGIALGTSAIRRIEPYGKGIAVACGDDGMRFVGLLKAGEFSENVVKAEEWGGADRFLVYTEKDAKRVVLVSRREGVRLAPATKGGRVLELLGSRQQPTDMIRGAPQGGVVMAAPQRQRQVLIVGLGDRGVKVLEGQGIEGLRPARELKVPCERLALGREFLAVAGAGKVAFISLSEVFSDEYEWDRYALHADAKVSIVANRAFIQSGTCHGTFLVRGSLEEACRRGAREAAGPTMNGITVVQRRDGRFCFGSAFIRDAKAVAFRPNARVTVGRGGAMLWGEQRKAGDVFLMDEFGLPNYIGGWGGTF